MRQDGDIPIKTFINSKIPTKFGPNIDKNLWNISTTGVELFHNTVPNAAVSVPRAVKGEGKRRQPRDPATERPGNPLPAKEPSGTVRCGTVEFPPLLPGYSGYPADRNSRSLAPERPQQKKTRRGVFLNGTDSIRKGLCARFGGYLRRLPSSAIWRVFACPEGSNPPPPHGSLHRRETGYRWDGRR